MSWNDEAPILKLANYFSILMDFCHLCIIWLIFLNPACPCGSFTLFLIKKFQIFPAGLFGLKFKFRISQKWSLKLCNVEHYQNLVHQYSTTLVVQFVFKETIRGLVLSTAFYIYLSSLLCHKAIWQKSIVSIRQKELH